MEFYLKTLDYFKNLKAVFNELDYDVFDQCAKIVISYINNNNKIMCCGNGGSASTASHYVTDWVKFAQTQNKKKLNAICLSDNIGMLTAYANDIDYDAVFSEQVKSYGENKDLLICVSGSGNSTNLLKAVEVAKQQNIRTMAVVGYDGGQLIKKCDYKVHIPSFDMQICEDIHLIFGHVVMKKIIVSQ
jgi:D-sedoheptulose 7-phosphate isomerase